MLSFVHLTGLKTPESIEITNVQRSRKSCSQIGFESSKVPSLACSVSNGRVRSYFKALGLHINVHSVKASSLPVKRKRIFKFSPKPKVIIGFTVTQADVLPGMPKSASCVQKFDDSLNSAIHTTYRILLRSSSMHKPRDPPS